MSLSNTIPANLRAPAALRETNKKEGTTDKPADRPLTQEQIDLKNSPLGITLGL